MDGWFIKQHNILILLCSLLLTIGCSSRKSQIVSQVQSMVETAELGTVEYKVRKIIKTNDEQWYSIGNRKILFQSSAYLKAGVKLDSFSADKIKIEGNDVSITLPHAELLSFNMPAEETRTVFEDYGFFRSSFSAEEQNRILQLGEQDIRDDVPNLGILQDAEKNVVEIFKAIFSQMGFEKINVKFE